MWLLILLLAPPLPLDVTPHTQAAPGKVSLNLSENLVLGDPMNGVLPTLATRLPAIEACLQRVGPAVLQGAGPTAVDLEIDASGALTRVSIAHQATRVCLREALKGLAFGPGRKRMGVVKLTVAEPTLPPIAPSVDAVSWTAPAAHLGVTVTARRVKLPSGRWRLIFESQVQAKGASRGVGEAPVRHNHSLLLANGRSRNGFSLQTSAGVARCLKPGERVTHTSKGSHTIGPGEMYSAQVFVLAGDCETGRGRVEIGVVQLDHRGVSTPVLRAMPTWAYRFYARHR